MIQYGFLKVPMAQNSAAVPMLDKFLRYVHERFGKINQIIELGTYQGGFSLFLHLASIMYGFKFVTYDIEDKIFDKKLFDSLIVDFRKKSIFTYEGEKEVSKIIKTPGISVLFCDNGQKIKEFNNYARYLKSGDYILAHDYCFSRTKFFDEVKDRSWNSVEITYQDIEGTVKEHGLAPFMQDEWNKAAWGCFRKEK